MKSLIAIIATAALFVTGCSTSPQRTAARSPGRPITDTGERPGIGTVWGEQRESWVEKASFVRGWTDRPGGVGILYYNDNEGVDAMLDYLGGESKHRTGLYPTANGLVSIGLRDPHYVLFSGYGHVGESTAVFDRDVIEPSGEIHARYVRKADLGERPRNAGKTQRRLSLRAACGLGWRIRRDR